MNKVKDIIIKQLSYEFNLSLNNSPKNSNIFTLKKSDDNFLFNNRTSTSIISYENRLLVRSDNENLLKNLKENYKDYPAAWFLEANNIYKLINILDKYNLKINNIFPVYVPKFIEKIENKENFYWLNNDDFKEYKKDDKYNFVLTYDKGELGLAYKNKGELIALEAASLEGRYFYDIGLEKYNFDEKYRGVSSYLLKYLTYYILQEENRIPICSTQFSHTKSLNLMVNAGYRLAFTNISIG